MAEKLDPRQVASCEELLWSIVYDQEATRRILVRKGLVSNEEVLEEIKGGAAWVGNQIQFKGG